MAVPTFKPQKDSEITWKSWNGGLNTLFRPTELRPNELAQADNIMLVGAGTPTGRWGSANYMLAGSGRVRLLDAYYNNGLSGASINNLLAITDSGYLVKPNGASYSIITGASFVSGYNYQSTELGFNTYIANSPNPVVKYNGTSLVPYVSLTPPTNVSAAFMSGATGTNAYSWVITALSQVGETDPSNWNASNTAVITTLPFSMASTYVKVSWNTVSAQASTLVGYNIYRGTQGNETLLASVDRSTTSYVDYGAPATQTVIPPIGLTSAGTTAGLVAKYVIKMGDRLIMAGINGDPSTLYVSGRYPYQDQFTAISGGGYCRVSPNDGDVITGLGVQNLQTVTPLIVVYKQNSTYVVTMDSIPLGNYYILDLEVHPLTITFGASSGDTVVPIENDVFALGRKGIFSTGQEPQFLNQIRTNELSARIRPYIQNLSQSDLSEATAAYIDYKYLVSFPTRKETIVYDYQRACFLGPWKTPFGITKWKKYYDTVGAENWLAGADDGNVYTFSSSYVSDNGATINKSMRTRKEDFGLFEQMKQIKLIYALFRNVRGNVNVNFLAEGRDGNTTVVKNFSVSSSLFNSGWGFDQWGSQQWGQSKATVTLTGEELARFSYIFKQFRVLQVEVTTTDNNSNFEFLQFKTTGVPLGGQSLSTKLKV